MNVGHMCTVLMDMMSMCVAVHSRGMCGSISVCYFIHNIHTIAKKNKHKPDVHNRNFTTVYIRKVPVAFMVVYIDPANC